MENKREREEDRLATFLKYRDDLYKEATELCTLCGAELAIIIFSPFGELYTFGHPNFEMVVNRFINLDPKQPVEGLSPEETVKMKAWLLKLEEKIRERREKLVANAPPAAVVGDDSG